MMGTGSATNNRDHDEVFINIENEVFNTTKSSSMVGTNSKVSKLTELLQGSMRPHGDISPLSNVSRRPSKERLNEMTPVALESSGIPTLPNACQEKSIDETANPPFEASGISPALSNVCQEKPPFQVKDFFNHADVLSVAREVFAKYNVDCCLISLIGIDAEITEAACYMSESEIKVAHESLRDTHLCKVMVKRDLPLAIVNDTHLQDDLCNDPLVVLPSEKIGMPNVRFYMEVPLIHPSSRCYMGTIAIHHPDAIAVWPPLSGLSLYEAEWLMTKRVVLTNLLDKLGFSALI
jgi:hypothetical protein